MPALRSIRSIPAQQTTSARPTARNTRTSTIPLQPYWEIAEKYGYANYMFQTNQGPSFPAHQFLLSGTSAPGSTQNPDYTYFDAENPQKTIDAVNPSDDAGCAALAGQFAPLVSPTQDESSTPYPCYEHLTLTDLLDQNQPSPITWRYYGDQDNSIWTARTPSAISATAA